MVFGGFSIMAAKKTLAKRRAKPSIKDDDDDMRGSFFRFNIGHVFIIVSMAVGATLFVSQINVANSRLDDMRQQQTESRAGGLAWQNEQRSALSILNGKITEIQVQLAGKVDRVK